MEDPYILRRYLSGLEADLESQTERVRHLREAVASLVHGGEDASIAKARLLDAEETLAVYASEAVRLERELAALS